MAHAFDNKREAGESMFAIPKRLCLVLIAAAAVSACSKNDSPAPTATTQAPQATAQLPANEQISPVANPPPPVPPPPPAHIYGYRDNGRYGYEPAISDDDRKAGIATKPLVMFRYLGMLGNRFLIEGGSGNYASRIECEAPCEYVKSITVSTTGYQKTEVLHLTAETLLTGVFTDAMNGLLVPTFSPIDHLFPADWTIARAPDPVAPPVEAAAISPPPVSTFIQPAQQRGDTQVLPPDDASVTAATTYQTSFDCSKARSDAEHLICGDPALAAMDVNLAATFARAKAAARDPVAFKERTRQQWNYREQNCHDRTCLERWYADQQTNLAAIAVTGSL